MFYLQLLQEHNFKHVLITENVAPWFVTLVETVTQFADQVKITLIFQLIKSILRVLQKLLKMKPLPQLRLFHNYFKSEIEAVVSIAGVGGKILTS